MNAESVGEKAKEEVKQVVREARPWVIRLGRLGFAAIGIVYILVGILPPLRRLPPGQNADQNIHNADCGKTQTTEPDDPRTSFADNLFHFFLCFFPDTFSVHKKILTKKIKCFATLKSLFRRGTLHLRQQNLFNN